MVFDFLNEYVTFGSFRVRDVFPNCGVFLPLYVLAHNGRVCFLWLGLVIESRSSNDEEV